MSLPGSMFPMPCYPTAEVEVPAKVQDKRLQIELNVVRQSIFLDDGPQTAFLKP